MVVKPDLKIKNLQITEHAALRVMERFDEVGNTREALTFCKNLLGGGSKYIGVSTAADGNQSHYYVRDKVAIHIGLDLKTIHTVINVDSHGHYIGLKERIIKLYRSEFNKTERFERSLIRKVEYAKIKTDADIAVLKYRSYKSRSKNVKIQCEQEIQLLKKEVLRLESELQKSQINKREIARAMATVVF